MTIGHRLYASAGDPGGTVQLPALTFATSGDSPVFSGIRFGADGNIYARQTAGGWSVVDQWLIKGSAGNFYISRSVITGTLTTDDGDNLQMSTDRDYDVQQNSPGTKEATVDFTISTDVSGTPIVAGPKFYTFSATVI